MKKIDESSIILRFSDDDKVIHDVGLDSILEGGFPIDTESGNDMEYLGVYLLPGNSSSNGGTRLMTNENQNLPGKSGLVHRVASRDLFGEWISVEDRLPEGSEVICWDGEMVSTYFPTTGEPPHTGRERCEYLGITHWMLMPNPPNVERSREG